METQEQNMVGFRSPSKRKPGTLDWEALEVVSEEENLEQLQKNRDKF